MQKQIFEDIFHLGKVSPSIEEIKWTTSRLSQHGEITKSNVRNKFKNRETRQKWKRKTELAYNIKVEPGVQSSNGKKIKLEKTDFNDNQYPNTNAYFF